MSRIKEQLAFNFCLHWYWLYQPETNTIRYSTTIGGGAGFGFANSAQRIFDIQTHASFARSSHAVSHPSNILVQVWFTSVLRCELVSNMVLPPLAK